MNCESGLATICKARCTQAGPAHTAGQNSLDGPSKQANKHTHAQVYEVTLVSGSLRLRLTPKYRASLVKHKSCQKRHCTFSNADLFSSSSWNNFHFSTWFSSSRSWIVSSLSLIFAFNCIWSCSISLFFLAICSIGLVGNRDSAWAGCGSCRDPEGRIITSTPACLYKLLHDILLCYVNLVCVLYPLASSGSSVYDGSRDETSIGSGVAWEQGYIYITKSAWWTRELNKRHCLQCTWLTRNWSAQAHEVKTACTEWIWTLFNTKNFVLRCYPNLIVQEVKNIW